MISIDVNPHVGVLTLNLDAPLASANVRALSDRAEAQIHRAGSLRGLVIRAPHFPPWRELSSMLDKLRGLQAQRPALARIAVITESSPLEFAGPLARYFPTADIDRFSPQRLDRAKAWVEGGQPEEGHAVELAGAPDTQQPVEADAVAAEAGVVELEGVESESGEEDDWFV